MCINKKPIVLASNSISRAKILSDFGIEFKQVRLDCDEDKIQTKNPKSFAYSAVRLKYECANKLFSDENNPYYNCSFIVADSVVSLNVGDNEVLLRKPKDKFEAKDMLEAQSAAKLKIISAQILKNSKIELCDISAFSVEFAKFDKDHMQEYLDSNLWIGKAGGVMIEGFHNRYIIKQKGFLSTALGLSIEKFLPFFGII